MKRKPVKKWKRIVRRVVLLIVALSLLAGGVWYAYGSLVSEYTVTYDPYTATKGSISNSLSFSGSFALIDSETYQATASATVKAVYVAAGDEVSEGDRLVRLSNGQTVEADFDARVNQVFVDAGDDVAANQDLVQIADFAHMAVAIRVDEYDIADVFVGQAVRVTATATEREFESAVSSINYISASQGNVAYYTAVADVDVGEGVYPGMQATVTITQEEANDVVILKADALSFDRVNNAFVYTKAEDGSMRQTYVTVGVSNGNYVEIKDGLSEGDTVYVEAEEEQTASGLSGLLSGLFGSQRVRGTGTMSGGTMPDFSNMESGTFPGGSSGTSGGTSGGTAPGGNGGQ